MNETVVEISKVNPNVFLAHNKYDKVHSDKNSIENRNKSEDIIVKELLDVQAATIGTRKLDSVLDPNAFMKHSQR